MNPEKNQSEHNKVTKPNRWLNEFANNVTSQYGEDGILTKIFEIIPGKNKGTTFPKKVLGTTDGDDRISTYFSNRRWKCYFYCLKNFAAEAFVFTTDSKALAALLIVTCCIFRSISATI